MPEVGSAAQQTPNLPEVQQHGGGIGIVTDIAVFNHMYRVGKIFAASSVVPEQFAGSEANCFVAVEMANRMGINPLVLMQNMAIVKGKPTLEAKLITALINDSGMFEEDLQYEVVGTEPGFKAGKPLDPAYKVRVHAVLRRTGERLYGEWITWDMVMGEGWHSKTGSKWLTIPGMMFRYRAASFFGKIYCTNLTMGMQTRDEMEDATISGPSARAVRAGGVVAGIMGAATEKVVEAVDAEVITEGAGGTLPE